MFCALLFNVTRKSQKSRKYVGAPKISCRRQRTDSYFWAKKMLKGTINRHKSFAYHNKILTFA